MRNGQRLSKLGTPDRAFVLFVKHDVSVVVKPLLIRAGQQQRRICGTAEIKFRRTAIVDAMKVAHRERRLRSLAWADNGLRSQKYFGYAVCALPRHAGMDEGFAGSQKLQTPMHGEFHDFVRCEARCKFGRVARGTHASLKL